MKNKLFFFYFIIIQCAFSFAQTNILERFPDNQIPYTGGYKAYYKDFHDIITEKGLKPCDNKQELYQFSVLIKQDSTIQFIKDLNPKVVEANKCAYNLAREVAKYQAGWNPALVNLMPKSAVARFIIYPDDLFSSYQDGYLPNFTAPVYNFYEKDHIKNFRKELVNKLDLKRFSWNDVFTVEAEFTVTKDGKLQDIILTKKTGLEEFDRMIVYTFKEMRKKWKPATINGLPVDFRYRMALVGSTDPVND